jgi:hypothetical protein
MKHFPLSYVLCVGLAYTAVAPVVRADAWNKRTAVTFHQPVEIPRIVLGPGTYVVKLVDSLSNRDLVQFLNERENHVFATVLAIPDYEPNFVPDHSIFTFEERAANSPEVLKTWFYPGDNYGEEFVYPKSETSVPAPQPANLPPRIASSEPQHSERQPAPASNAVTAQSVAPVKPTPAPPVELAQAQPAPSAVHSEAAKELPKTASSLPLIALLGLLSATGGTGLRVLGNLFEKS